MSNEKIDLKSLKQNGFAEIKFANQEALQGLQDLITSCFEGSPLDWHKLDVSQEEHIKFVKQITDKIVTSDLVTKLIAQSADVLKPILGPDIDVQRSPHFRLSRPGNESDLVDWHRDTFYGNTAWEMNIWFPVLPLAEGAGLCLLPGSHRIPSTNVREIKDTDPYRSRVTKGSVENQVGYVYLAKTDDLMSNLKTEDVVTLRPEVGSAILFFGSCLHRARNFSHSTRVSIDVRVKNINTQTNTRAGYYKSLTRGIIEECAALFLGTKT